MTTPMLVRDTRLRTELPSGFDLLRVYRRESQAGRQREFYQTGVELVGAAGPDADAEVISLAAEALKLAGVEDFRITVGHVDVLTGVLKGAGFSAAEQEQAKIALSNKDLVAWEGLRGSELSGKKKAVASPTTRWFWYLANRRINQDEPAGGTSKSRRVEDPFHSSAAGRHRPGSWAGYYAGLS